MPNPIVIGKKPSGAVAGYFGICVEIQEAKREGAAILEEVVRVEDLAAGAAELLRDALFEIGYIKNAVQQGSLFT